jgi:glutaredoxin-related protein
MYVSNLCPECAKIQKYMLLYGAECVYDILNKVLLVKNVEKKTDKVKLDSQFLPE